MSYEDKYLKYKTKYLQLKAYLENKKQSGNLNMFGGAEDVDTNPNKESVNEVVSEEKAPEAPTHVVETPAHVVETPPSPEAAPETVTETTVNKETDVEEKFKQAGGAKKKTKSKSNAKKSAYKKHFFSDDSDITDKSSEDSKSDFSSSELDW